MNDCVKLILILIAVLVLFTYVTGAHKETEHFAKYECGKEYISDKAIICPPNCPLASAISKPKKKCDADNNCETVLQTSWKCKKF
jgi:hypothetical protein